MATKAYTISMPEEIMAALDEMARAEHRSRSEMLRELVRVGLAGHRGSSAETMREAAAIFQAARPQGVTDEEIDQAVTTAIRGVRHGH